MKKRVDLRDYMPFRGELFFASTRLWPWDEVGLYLWALWQQWASGRSQVISEEAHQQLSERVRRKFKKVRGGWRNRKCYGEYRDALKNYSDASERNSANAKKGWEKRGASRIESHSARMRLDANNHTTTTPHQTSPVPLPSGERTNTPRANPLVAGRRPELETELLELVAAIAAAEGSDSTLIMAQLSEYDGKSIMNPGGMGDDRLLQTLNAARKRRGPSGAAEERAPPVTPAPDAVALWAGISTALREKLGERAWSDWIRPTIGIRLDGKALTVAAPSEQFRNWIMSAYFEYLTPLALVAGVSKVVFEVASIQESEDVSWREE